jgi:hypothetical protein
MLIDNNKEEIGFERKLYSALKQALTMFEKRRS